MSDEAIFEPKFTVYGANALDYFGAWAIEERAFRGFVGYWQGTNLREHVNSAHAISAVAEQNRGGNYVIEAGGIAVIGISGPTMKSVSSMSGGTSTVLVRQQLRNARKDPKVAAAMLRMDTPGGTVKGNQDLVDEVRAFAKEKPIYAFIEDLTASAGVSVASQATKRYANNATALYGAMGTYSVLQDTSGMAERLGVKVHVIRAGEFKGIGEAGTEITPAQVAEAQRVVNMLNESYLLSIASGLGKSLADVRTLADGRVHSAADAVKMGLIDGIRSYDDTLQQLAAEVRGSKSLNSTMKGGPMSQSPSAEGSRESVKNAFSHLVAAKLQRSPNMTRQRAIQLVAREEPGLHQAYLRATNPKAAWGSM